MFIVFFSFLFRIVRIRRRRKVHIRYVISDEFLVFNLLNRTLGNSFTFPLNFTPP